MCVAPLFTAHARIRAVLPAARAVLRSRAPFVVCLITKRTTKDARSDFETSGFVMGEKRSQTDGSGRRRIVAEIEARDASVGRRQAARARAARLVVASAPGRRAHPAVRRAGVLTCVPALQRVDHSRRAAAAAHGGLGPSALLDATNIAHALLRSAPRRQHRHERRHDTNPKNAHVHLLQRSNTLADQR